MKRGGKDHSQRRHVKKQEKAESTRTESKIKVENIVNVKRGEY